MSIQLSLDGHSFSTPELSGSVANEEPIELELRTSRTLLVPFALYDSACAAEMLAAGGILPQVGERIVCTKSVDDAVAVMSVDNTVLDAIENRYHVEHYLSPLLFTPAIPNRIVWVCRRAGLLYIKVYDSTLLLAEVLAVSTDVDLRYLFDRIAAEFPLANYRLHLSGEKVSEMKSMLKNRFKEVICE